MKRKYNQTYSPETCKAVMAQVRREQRLRKKMEAAELASGEKTYKHSLMEAPAPNNVTIEPEPTEEPLKLVFKKQNSYYHEHILIILSDNKYHRFVELRKTLACSSKTLSNHLKDMVKLSLIERITREDKFSNLLGDKNIDKRAIFYHILKAH